MYKHLLGAVEMTNDEYHSSPGVSKSHLDLIHEKSPLHYWHRYLNPDREPDEKTAAMARGSATHAAILQPDVFETLVVKGLPHDRRSKENQQKWKDFEELHKDRIIITADAYEKIMPLRDAMWRHPEVSKLLTNILAETSIFAMMDVPVMGGDGEPYVDPVTGKVQQGLVKCQPDALARDFSYMIDLKSTADASKRGFGRSAGNYRYPVQPAWYAAVMESAFEGRRPDCYVFLAFEPEPPYACGIYYMTDADMALGTRAAMRDYAIIEYHRRLNWWPDYAAQGMEPLEIGKYVRL